MHRPRDRRGHPGSCRAKNPTSPPCETTTGGRTTPTNPSRPRSTPCSWATGPTSTPKRPNASKTTDPAGSSNPSSTGSGPSCTSKAGRVRITSRCVSEVTYRLGEFQDNLPHLTTGLSGLDGTILDGELVFPGSSLDTGRTIARHPLQAATAILSTSPEQARRLQAQAGAPPPVPRLRHPQIPGHRRHPAAPPGPSRPPGPGHRRRRQPLPGTRPDLHHRPARDPPPHPRSRRGGDGLETTGPALRAGPSGRPLAQTEAGNQRRGLRHRLQAGHPGSRERGPGRGPGIQHPPHGRIRPAHRLGLRLERLGKAEHDPARPDRIRRG